VAQDLKFVEFVVDQIDEDCEITGRAMFGGHTLYSKGKVVALICDDQLFVKPTDAGRAFIGDVVEAPAYEGSKLFFLIEEKLEDRDWLSQLISITEQALPPPKPKRKKKKK
jgi:TfoX/Sxy family transcriptional regulator of competence genes